MAPVLQGAHTKKRSALGALALIFIVVGLYWGLVHAPPDAYQGNVQRIMYLHVPSILTAYLSFFIVFVGSCLYLWKRERRDDILAHSAAEIGVLFTALTIIEGSIWGKPTWGVWWTWDARLTSMAVLFLIYAGYMALRSFVEDDDRRARWSAAVAVFGFLNVPIVYMSVRWWRTIHQVQSTPDTVDPLYKVLLRLNAFAVLFLFVFFVGLRYYVARLERARAALLEEEALVGREVHV